MFFSLLKTALQDLWANKGKTALTMLGVIVGITSVIIIMSVGQGVQNNIIAQIESYGQNLLVVVGGATSKGGLAGFTGTIKTISWEDFIAMKSSSIFTHVKDFTAISGRTQAHIRRRNADIIVPIQGNDGHYFDMYNYTIGEGRNFTQTENESLARVAILAPGAKEKLYGTFSPLGEFVRINNINFKIVGVLDENNAFERQTGASEFQLIHVPPRTAQKLLLNDDYLLGVGAEVSSAENLESVRLQLEQFLRRRHRLRDDEKNDFSVLSMQEFVQLFETVTGVMTLFLSILAAISLLVGGIGIMNVMLASVVRRTKEVGLRKALGARNNTIILQFLMETILLMVIGAIIGIIFGIFVSTIIANYGGWPDHAVSIISIPLAFGVSFAFGILFGLYPAIKAAKMDPIEALRYE